MSFNNGLRYSKDRKAFGKAICEFGLIQEKLANMATGIFVSEAICYRTVGMVAKALEGIDKNDHVEIQKRIEDYAVECSIVKVAASEILDMVVDESLQIFGGYGYVEDFPAERAYRDARINRIFEGTNEINRLIITGMLIKSAMAGKLALMPAIKTIMEEVMSGPAEKEEREGPLAAEYDLLAAAKKLTLFTAGAAVQKYMMTLADQQEVMGALSDMIISVYTMESAILRAEKIAATKGTAADPCRDGPHPHRNGVRHPRTQRPHRHRRHRRGRHGTHSVRHPAPPRQARSGGRRSPSAEPLPSTSSRPESTCYSPVFHRNPLHYKLCTEMSPR